MFSLPTADFMSKNTSYKLYIYDTMRADVLMMHKYIGVSRFCFQHCTHSFYRATRMHSADYAVARCLSVCPTVRLSHECSSRKMKRNGNAERRRRENRGAEGTEGVGSGEEVSPP